MICCRVEHARFSAIEETPLRKVPMKVGDVFAEVNPFFCFVLTSTGVTGQTLHLADSSGSCTPG